MNGTFSCKVCNRPGPTGSSQDWLNHVTSLGHQRILMRLPGGGTGPWAEDISCTSRAVSVSRCKELNASSLDIAEYLSQYGSLEEFICPTSLAGTKPDTVFALYIKGDSVKDLLEVKTHRIFKELVDVKQMFKEFNFKEINETVVVEDDNDTDDFEPPLIIPKESTPTLPLPLPATVNSHPSSTPKSQTQSAQLAQQPSSSSPWTWEQEEIESMKALPLESQLPKLFTLISVTPSEIIKRSKQVKFLEQLLCQTFSNAILFSYGNDAYGAAMHNDRLFVNVDPYGTIQKPQPGKKTPSAPTPTIDSMTSSLIHQILSTHVTNNLPTFTNVSNSPPNSIKLSYKETEMSLTFDSSLSIQRSKLVKFLFRQDPRVHPLLMLLRYWSSSYGIFSSKAEKIEDNLILFLLLFYLIRIKLLPTVPDLQNKEHNPVILRDLDIGFCCDYKLAPPSRNPILEDKSLKTLSILSLLQGFFELFSSNKIDFKNSVLCIGIGMEVPKRYFKPHLESKLPEEIVKRYRWGVKGDLRLEKLDTEAAICLMDVFDLSENLGRDIGAEDLELFKKECIRGGKQVKDFLENGGDNILLLFGGGSAGNGSGNEIKNEPKPEIIVKEETRRKRKYSTEKPVVEKKRASTGQPPPASGSNRSLIEFPRPPPPPMVPFEQQTFPIPCPSCKTTFPTIPHWLSHLTSQVHQRFKRKLAGKQKSGSELTGWSIDRTINVGNVKGIPSIEIIQYLGGWGPIEDFCYLSKRDTASDNCNVLMKDCYSAQTILKSTHSHRLHDRIISLRRPQFAPPKQLTGPPQKDCSASVDTTSNYFKTSTPGGIQSDGTFYCKLCDSSFSPLAGWLTHLTSQRHQDRHRTSQFLRKTLWDLERCVNVNLVGGLLSRVILDYLVDYGPVEDFSYLNKADGACSECHCLFSCRQTVVEITQHQNHRIQTKHISITQIQPDLKSNWRKWSEKIKAQYSNDGGVHEFEELEGISSLEGPEEDIQNQMVQINEMNRRERLHPRDCVTCDLQFNSEDNWIDHLISFSHRKMTNALPSSGLRFWNHKLGAILKGLTGLLRLDIIQFCKGWGDVADFIYPAEEDGASSMAYALFNNESAVVKLVNSPGFLVLGSTRITAEQIPPFSGYTKVEKQKLRAVTTPVVSQPRNNVPLESFQDECSKIISLLDSKSLPDQITSLLAHVSWKEEDMLKARKVIEEIQNLMKKNFSLKNKNLIPYGQIVTNVSLKKRTEILTLIELDSQGTTTSLPLPSSQLLSTLRQALETHTSTPTTLSPTESIIIPTPHPTLHFINNLTTKTTVALLDILPSQHSKLINFYTKLDPRVQPLITIITYIIELYNLFKSPEELFPHQISSFLVIFFLTHKNILPTIHKLQCLSTNNKPKLVQEGWNTDFTEDFESIKDEKIISMLSDSSIRSMSIIGLLKDWFEFYATVDIQKHVLCMRFGSLVPKISFLQQNVGDLPGDLSRLYRFTLEGQPRGSFLNVDSPICLQDPFVLSLNLTKTRGGKVVSRFKGFCQRFVIRLEKEMGEEVPNIKELFKLRWVAGQEAQGPQEKMIKLDSNCSSISEQDFNLNEDESLNNSFSEDVFEDTFKDNQVGSDDKKYIIEILSSEGSDDDEDQPARISSDATFITATISLNKSLTKYFHRNFNGDNYPNDPRKTLHLQTLLLHFSSEFTSVFFTRCFNLSTNIQLLQPKPDFLKIEECLGLYTLEQRFGSINFNLNRINHKFKINSNASKKSHSILCSKDVISYKKLSRENPKILSELTKLLYNEDPSILPPFFPLDSPIELSAELSGQLPNIQDAQDKEPALAKLTLICTNKTDEAMENRVTLLKALWRKFGMRYVDKRVKMWLSSCSDFNREKADNFQRNMHSKWNSKANKKKKRAEKNRIERKNFVRNPNFNMGQNNNNFGQGSGSRGRGGQSSMVQSQGRGGQSSMVQSQGRGGQSSMVQSQGRGGQTSMVQSQGRGGQTSMGRGRGNQGQRYFSSSQQFNNGNQSWANRPYESEEYNNFHYNVPQPTLFERQESYPGQVYPDHRGGPGPSTQFSQGQGMGYDEPYQDQAMDEERVPIYRQQF